MMALTRILQNGNAQTRGPKSLNFPDGKFQCAKTFWTKCVNRFCDKKVRKSFLRQIVHRIANWFTKSERALEPINSFRYSQNIEKLFVKLSHCPKYLKTIWKLLAESKFFGLSKSFRTIPRISRLFKNFLDHLENILKLSRPTGK